MSRTTRRPRRAGRHAPPAPRASQIASSADPATSLRALVEEGIVAAAALNARDDLEFAAASTQRLGSLSSGMWRALSRELATAAERLDRSISDRLEMIDRRARSLQVDPEEVVAVGVAAAHLAEHRDRLETLLKPGQHAHHLLGPSMLFGYSLDAAADEAEEEGEKEPKPGAVEVALFLWPMPLTPVIVSIVPSLLAGAIEGDLRPQDVSLALAVNTSPLMYDALTSATELSSDDVMHALTSLAVACWTAHTLDELPPDDEDEEEEEDNDTEHDAAHRPGDR